MVPSVLLSAGCFAEPLLAEDLSPARNKKPDVPVRYSGCGDGSASWKRFISEYPFPLPPDVRNINYCSVTDWQSSDAYLRFEADEPGARQFLERIGAEEEQTVAYTGPEAYSFNWFVPGDLVPGRTYGMTYAGDTAGIGPVYGTYILIDRDRGAPSTLTVMIRVLGN